MEASIRTKKNRVQRSESEWKAILDEYDRSGQSRAAFCRRTGVSPSTFLLRERQLRRQNRAAEFVAVTPATQPTGSWVVEFQFSDGATARVRG